jgi:hypothetical protein
LTKPAEYVPGPVASAMHDVDFVRRTVEPVPYRNPTLAEARTMEHACRAFLARVLGDLPGKAPRRAERFASAADAISTWYASRIDGAPIPSPADSERLRTVAWAGRSPPRPGAPWAAERDAMVAVERALEDAGRRFVDPEKRFRRQDAIDATVRRFAKRHGLDDIAADVSRTQGAHVTAKRVAQVTGWVYSEVYGALRFGGLVPEEARREVIAMAGEPTTGPKAGELRGWKAIADHLGFSESAVRKWADLHGLPVARMFRSVLAFAHELDAWKHANLRREANKDAP